MKNAISMIFGLFILSFLVDNISFVYAQNEDSEENTTNELVNIVNDDNQPDLNSGENIITENTNQIEDEIDFMDDNEENLNIGDQSGETEDKISIKATPKLGGSPILGISQTTQVIDTSDYGIIRIKDPNNTGKGITMLDRNLGATATGAGADAPIESYGYYYQWGNNYGFSSNGEIITTGTRVDASDYGPANPYSSNIFITGSDWSTVRNNNLRGGLGDSKNGNGWGYPLTNASDRKGPCPENYHVPSAGEWSKLLEIWANNYTGSLNLLTDSSTNLKYFNNLLALNNFYRVFYIPVAGKLSYQNANLIEIGDQALIRSSSPKTLSNNGIFAIFGGNSYLYSYGSTDYRANAFPIRCFYNSYRLPVIITYNLSGGYWAEDESTETKVITYTKSDDDSNFSGDIILGTVKRDANCGNDGDKKCMFGGWYILTGDVMWTGNMVEDISLYAKWLPYEDKDISYSGANFTIMDRNLGAENSGTGEDAYGYYLTGGEIDILCPEGYHIPSTGEWKGIQRLLGSDFNSDLVKNLLDLPFAGKMINNGDIEDEDNGYYLANNGTEIMYAKISDSGINITNLDEGDNVSVRCFRDYNTGAIKFDSKGGNNISDIVAVNWREDGEDLDQPSRENSIFLGWYTTSDFQEGTKLERNINYKNEEEINLYAKWECEQGYQENSDKCEKIPQKSGGSSGGGGKGNKKDSVILSGTKGSEESGTGNTLPIDSSADKSVSELQGNGEKIPPTPLNKGGQKGAEGNNTKGFSQEFIDAYNFAYQNGITAKAPIENAKLYSPLTRIQMAKMLSNYAINVLGKEPDISKGIIKFSDVSDKLNKQYGNAVTLAYQLGIMGQNIKSGKFRPYDTVTRAEFATALSRLLYGTTDGKGKIKYYEPHVNKLYNEGIINKTNPTIKEKRGYVMIMLEKVGK